MSFPPSYKKLVGDLNGKAESAGLGPIAEVDYSDDEKKFKLDDLPSSFRHFFWGTDPVPSNSRYTSDTQYSFF